MRRKLFTAINLACIVLTLVVLMVISALLDTAFWPTGVEGRSDRLLQVYGMHAKRYESPAFPHLNLGRVYEKKGDWTEAIASYKQALALNPDYVLAKRSLGRLVSMLN